jgi:cardiolipin synthase
MAAPDLNRLRAWTSVPAPVFVGGNQVDLLQGGDELFPRMCGHRRRPARGLAGHLHLSRRHGRAGRGQALHRAAARGVAVHVLVDGFGSIKTLAHVRQLFAGTGVQLEVFRPLDRWYSWLQPGQLRRLHQKLCVCDKAVAFVGGINVIDDRHDMNHGWQDTPRLDFAVEMRGPLVLAVQATARAMWARAHMVRNWRSEFQRWCAAAAAWRARGMLRQLRGSAVSSVPEMAPPPMRAAFLVRDNLRQRRAIERSYVAAIRHARTRVDIAVPYFYPGRGFMRALRHAARRGVRVRLLLQGKIDYRIAALAAQALYDELRFSGVRIFEYTPAFLHAKVALVDDDWATVGSSNIDPLSLLLNLEANVVVRDAQFTQALAMRFEAAFAASTEVSANTRTGLRGWLRRALVAWSASIYLRLAGITGRY